MVALFNAAYCAFLRPDELAKSRCCNVNFHNLGYVKIDYKCTSSKTDVYRDGFAGTVPCPYTILSRYFHLAVLIQNSSDQFISRCL